MRAVSLNYFFGVVLEFIVLLFFSVDRRAGKNVRGRRLGGKKCCELLSFGHGMFIAYNNV